MSTVTKEDCRRYDRFFFSHHIKNTGYELKHSSVCWEGIRCSLKKKFARRVL